MAGKTFDDGLGGRFVVGMCPVCERKKNMVSKKSIISSIDPVPTEKRERERECVWRSLTTNNIRSPRLSLENIHTVQISIHELHVGEFGSHFGAFVAISYESRDFVLGVSCRDGIHGIAANVAC